MVLTDQFIERVAGNISESLVRVGNISITIGDADNPMLIQRELLVVQRSPDSLAITNQRADQLRHSAQIIARGVRRFAIKLVSACMLNPEQFCQGLVQRLERQRACPHLLLQLGICVTQFCRTEFQAARP